MDYQDIFCEHLVYTKLNFLISEFLCMTFYVTFLSVLLLYAFLKCYDAFV